jgi:hypothetical protein
MERKVCESVVFGRLFLLTLSFLERCVFTLFLLLFLNLNITSLEIVSSHLSNSFSLPPVFLTFFSPVKKLLSIIV